MSGAGGSTPRRKYASPRLRTWTKRAFRLPLWARAIRVSTCFGLLKPWGKPSTQRARSSGVPSGWRAASTGSAVATGSGAVDGAAVAPGDWTATGPAAALQPWETIRRRHTRSPRLRNMRGLCLGAEHVGSCRRCERTASGGSGDLAGGLFHDQAPDVIAQTLEAGGEGPPAGIHLREVLGRLPARLHLDQLGLREAEARCQRRGREAVEVVDDGTSQLQLGLRLGRPEPLVEGGTKGLDGWARIRTVRGRDAGREAALRLQHPAHLPQPAA